MQNDDVLGHIQSDFAKLLDVFIDTRIKLLGKHDTLIPMAMVLNEAGEPQFVALKPNSEFTENIESYLHEYRDMLADQYSENVAHLLGYDIHLKNNNEYTDAICCELTHITGNYIRIAVPFSKNKLSKNITTGDLIRFE